MFVRGSREMPNLAIGRTLEIGAKKDRFYQAASVGFKADDKLKEPPLLVIPLYLSRRI